MKLVSVVLPFFNEAGNVARLFERLSSLLVSDENIRYEFVCVDDGSSDETLTSLKTRRLSTDGIRIISLSRNFGKEAALSAGLDHARGDAVVFMDTDLQHPPEMVPKFVGMWLAGAPVVAGRRSNRDSDGRLYRWAATKFYRVHNRISNVKLLQDVGDFRLVSREVADHLRSLPESQRFMKGLFAWVGYPVTVMNYDVSVRESGRSSFNKWRSWNLALEGITSFSTFPLRLWTYLGMGLSALGLLYALIIFVQTVAYGVVVPGYVTLLTAVIVFGGVQLIGIGVLGEYIGRIYFESKRRPVYLVKEVVG